MSLQHVAVIQGLVRICCLEMRLGLNDAIHL